MGRVKNPKLNQVLPIVEKKDSLRKDILQKRLRLPFEEIFELSSIVQKKFLGIKELKKARRLAIYSSFRNEVLTETIFEYAVIHKKEVFFPRIIREKRELIFLRVHGKNDLVSGSYDIKEPAHTHRGANPKHKPEIAVPSSLDIIVMPGIVFDKSGNRLGYGKGYYDKTLAANKLKRETDDIKEKCLLVGLAFNFQVVDIIPAEGHDIKMDRIITESRVINTAGSS